MLRSVSSRVKGSGPRMARLRGCGLQWAARGPHPRVGRAPGPAVGVPTRSVGSRSGTFQPDNSDADLRKQALAVLIRAQASSAGIESTTRSFFGSKKTTRPLRYETTDRAMGIIA